MQRGEYQKARETKDGSALSVGLVVSSFNTDITGGMLEGALATLKEWGVKEDRIHVQHVPGAYELPYGCQQLIDDKKPDAVIAIGCVIKGDTDHDRYIADAAANGLMRVMLDTKTPISFGVITTNNLEQAVIRSTGETNKGREAALAVLELLLP
ncbi:MAG TPA: 6,7-dimethyl-8-ribityllumazine synthase [Candidatus Paceibacterota bacterium]|nr:6,7-dimethyl-8-ribityllumazine synthase [Candidatus Paceibacterota bacterium]